MKRLVLTLFFIMLSACSIENVKQNNNSSNRFQGMPEDFDHERSDQDKNIENGFYYNHSGFMVRLNQKATSYTSGDRSIPDMTTPNEDQDVFLEKVQNKPIVIDLEND